MSFVWKLDCIAEITVEVEQGEGQRNQQERRETQFDSLSSSQAVPILNPPVASDDEKNPCGDNERFDYRPEQKSES